jgi:hypothetical protein
VPAKVYIYFIAKKYQFNDTHLRQWYFSGGPPLTWKNFFRKKNYISKFENLYSFICFLNFEKTLKTSEVITKKTNIAANVKHKTLAMP